MKCLAPLILTQIILSGQSAPKDETFGIVRAFYLMMARENKDIDKIAIYMYRGSNATVFLKTYTYLNESGFKGFIYTRYDRFEELEVSFVAKIGISFHGCPKQITINGETFDLVDGLRLGPKFEI